MFFCIQKSYTVKNTRNAIGDDCMSNRNGKNNIKDERDEAIPEEKQSMQKNILKNYEK